MVHKKKTREKKIRTGEKTAASFSNRIMTGNRPNKKINERVKKRGKKKK